MIPPDLFEDDGYYTGPALDAEMVRLAEEALGVQLPPAYVDLLSTRNGGLLRYQCLPVAFSNTSAGDHIEVRALFGIGGSWGIERLSGYLIAEWGYPSIGVVICDLPSGGHDTVMLDYSVCGPTGGPSVAYIDEDRVPRTVADSFADFIAQLTVCT